ncbi:MAG: hypothetical protein ACYCSP_16080 [Acidobacteriaceae bacterium]
MNPDLKAKRGEVWRADLGDGKKHAVVIVSLDARNLSERASSILVMPFGNYGAEGPTTLRMEQATKNKGTAPDSSEAN